MNNFHLVMLEVKHKPGKKGDANIMFMLNPMQHKIKCTAFHYVARK